MNFTIIGHTENDKWFDQCGNERGSNGKFDTKFFREEQKDEFLRAWAHAQFHGTYEDLVILINGIPEDQMTDDECKIFDKLLDEMQALIPQIKVEHEAAEKIRKDQLAEAALEKARKIAAKQRANDLAQLESLQRKLGYK